MKKIIVFITLIIVISTLSANFVEGNILFKSDVLINVTGNNSGVVITDRTWFNTIASNYQISKMDTLFTIQTGDYEGAYYLAEFNKMYDIEDVIFNLEKESNIEYAEPDHELELFGINTDDSYNSTSLGLEKIGMNQVWSNQIAYGGNVKVAVLDSGIDLGINDYGIHPDLESNLWDDGQGAHGFNVLGYLNFDDEDVNIPQDKSGHGTHVAGIIGASTNNSLGVAGVAGGWNNLESGCQLMPVRMSNILPSASFAVIGINWAFRNGAEVVNMSWGVPNAINQTLRNRISSIMLEDYNIVFVAAAGNEGANSIAFPANIPGVISVGATGINDAKASYTNYGNLLDICAPGNGIVSTTPQNEEFTNHNLPYNPWSSNYEYADGTSMSAPMVSGAVALIKDTFPDLTREQIIQRLKGTADDLTQMNTNSMYMRALGTGRLNVYRALTEGNHPAYRLHNVTVDDTGDGVLSTGEDEVRLSISLKNWWESGSDVVVGHLTTDDPFINIDEGNGQWNPISSLGFDSSSDFIISDSSPYGRNIRFSLELFYEGRTDIVYFEVPCVPKLEELVDLSTYQLTSEVAIFDMNNDGLDELAFGLKKPINDSFEYFACLYRNSHLFMEIVNDSIITKPAFGDIIYGDNAEVVFVTNAVTVYAYDSNLDDINQYPITFSNQLSGDVKSLIVDDLTGNGRMDILVNGNDYDNDSGFYGTITQHNYPSTDLETEYYTINGSRFLSEMAVGNVDQTLYREFTAVVSGSNNGSDNWVGIFKGNFVSGSKDDYVNVGDIEWVIDPGIDSITNLRSTNLLLVKPQFTNPDEPVYHNRLFFGITKDFHPGIERTTSYTTYCYDFGDEDPVQIWSHVDNTPSPIDEIDNIDLTPGKIIAGDFYPDNFGIEILTTASEEVLDVEQGYRINHTTNDYSSENGGYYHKNRRPSLLADLGESNIQDVVLSKDNELSVYQVNEEPLQSYNINFFANIKSMAIGSAFSTSIRDLYVLVGNQDTNEAKIYRIPIKNNNIDEMDEWTQFSNNERNTAQYLYNIPSVVDESIHIRQDVVINKNICIDPGVGVKVNPGIEIRIRNKNFINNNGEFHFNGTELYPVVVKGMCPNTIQDHWLGISSVNNSSLIVNNTYLSNAEIGLEMYDNGTYVLKNSILNNNEVSILAYDVLVDFGHDKILNSDIGIASYKSAVPYLAYNGTGENKISDNGVGLLAVQSQPYLHEGFNNFTNIQAGQLNIVTENMKSQIKADQNWWGHTNETDIKSTFSQYEDINYDHWLTTPNGSAGRDGMNEPFYLAENARINSNWDMAIQYYYQVLNDSLLTDADFQVLKGITVCHSKTNQVPDLIEWIDAKLISYPNQNDFRRELLNTKALCNRLIYNFQGAIDHYASIIESPPTYNDSCFAVIDMGSAWLESGGKCTTKYSSLMPRSRNDHIMNTRKILASLRNPENTQSQVIPLKPVLYNCYPNPFNPSTNIRYFIPQKSRVKLNIYNVRGQKVKTLLDSDMEKGQYQIVWNGNNNQNKKVASGMYFYKLESNKQAVVKKCLLIK